MGVHADGGPSLREVMGAFPTGVTIVASRDDDGTPYGLTVNSFTSVSLDPPLILVCIGHSSTSHDRLVSTESFAVSILSASQGEIAARFARDPSEGRFDDVAWTPGSFRAPVIDGAVAWLECTREAVVQGGDHSILVGRVQGLEVTDRPALVFHRGRLSASGG